jgi:hypothetical protein
VGDRPVVSNSHLARARCWCCSRGLLGLLTYTSRGTGRTELREPGDEVQEAGEMEGNADKPQEGS